MTEEKSLIVPSPTTPTVPNVTDPENDPGDEGTRGRGRPKGSKNKPKIPPELLMPWIDRLDFRLHIDAQQSDPKNANNPALAFDQQRAIDYVANGFRLMHDTNAVRQITSGVSMNRAPGHDAEIRRLAVYLLTGAFAMDKLSHSQRMLTRDGWHRILEDDDPIARWSVCYAVNMTDVRGPGERPCFEFVPGSQRYPELFEPAPPVRTRKLYLEQGHVLLWHPRVLLRHDPQDSWGGGLTAGVFTVNPESL